MPTPKLEVPPNGIPSTPEGIAENRRRMDEGVLYYAFTPDLIQSRNNCSDAVHAYNSASRLSSRREYAKLWNAIVENQVEGDAPKPKKTLPPVADTPEADAALFDDEPWVEVPLTRIDYGFNIRLGQNVYVNSGSTWVDTLPITIGSRTLIGPNCSFYSGTHPLDPAVRNGTRGPEYGQAIVVGEDCWFGGNVTVCPGVTIGDGVTVGAGSVVTKDVPSRVVVAGNPARIIRKIE